MHTGPHLSHVRTAVRTARRCQSSPPWPPCCPNPAASIASEKAANPAQPKAQACGPPRAARPPPVMQPPITGFHMSCAARVCGRRAAMRTAWRQGAERAKCRFSPPPARITLGGPAARAPLRQSTRRRRRARRSRQSSCPTCGCVRQRRGQLAGAACVAEAQLVPGLSSRTRRRRGLEALRKSRLHSARAPARVTARARPRAAGWRGRKSARGHARTHDERADTNDRA